MIHGSMWTFVASVTSFPLAFVVNLVLARTLGPVGLGRLATYLAIVSVATTVSISALLNQRFSGLLSHG